MVKRYSKVLVWSAITGLLVLVGLILPLSKIRGARAEFDRQAGPSIPIDRWLVADPIAPEEETARTALAGEALGAEASRDLFPERDIELAGAYWHLVRRDSSAAFDLDSLFPERPAVAVTYAHAYVWSPDPRAVRLRWREPECGGAVLRLNALRLRPASPAESRAATQGDPARVAEGDSAAAAAGSEVERSGEAGSSERAMLVRLVQGWNTLLAEVAAGECAYPLEVHVEAGDGLADPDAAPATSLVGLRVQASRPPGVRRVDPGSLVTVGEARVLGLGWIAGQNELAADLWLELAAWGAPAAVVRAKEPEGGEEEEGPEGPPPAAQGRRPPGRPGERPPPPPEAIADPERDRLAALRARLLPEPPPPQPAPARVELVLKAGGEEVRRATDLEGPGRAIGVRLGFRLLDLERAARSGGLEARLRWSVDGDDRRIEGRLVLSPQAVRVATGAIIELEGWMQAEDGSWSGEWRVPAVLAGASLGLSVESAAGRWTLNGREVETERTIPLCAPCSSGDRLRLEVIPTGGWTGPPRVTVSGRG